MFESMTPPKIEMHTAAVVQLVSVFGFQKQAEEFQNTF